MEAKKKWILTLTSLCGVMFAAIVAMGIVWAATSQTITSNVKVTYTATEIAGSMSANVYFGNDTAVPMKKQGTDETSVTFDGQTATTSGTLTPQNDVVLINEAGKTFAIFEYVITNASTTSAMSAVLTYVDDTTSTNVADSNVKVYAYSSSSAVSQPHTNVATIYGTSEANLLGSTTGQFISDQVSANSTKYYYIVVAVNNLANDAEFSGAFNWVLTKYTPAP